MRQRSCKDVLPFVQSVIIHLPIHCNRHYRLKEPKNPPPLWSSCARLLCLEFDHYERHKTSALFKSDLTSEETASYRNLTFRAPIQVFCQDTVSKECETH